MTASTPWRVIVEHVEDSPPLVYICDRENHVIAYLPEHRWEHRPVFDMLVKCVNLQAELLDALECLMEGNVFSSIEGDAFWHVKKVPSNAALDKARAVLLKAKGAKQ